MPSYVLIGLMVVTMVLPVVPAVAVSIANEQKREYFSLVMFTLWLLSIGLLLATWAASVTLHPTWWDSRALPLIAGMGGVFHLLFIVIMLASSEPKRESEAEDQKKSVAEAAYHPSDEQIEAAVDKALHGVTEKPT